MAKMTVLTVSQLNRYVKTTLEENPLLREVYVEGEISNFTRHYASGHCYFTLKDGDAAIRAVMFRSNAQLLRFSPENGMKVVVRAYVTLYERDGTYQLGVSEMQPSGVGALQVAYEQLKNKLAAEGLFDNQYKQPIPRFPKGIAVITSAGGAALQDVRNVLERRYPSVRVILLPVSVQGALAVPELLSAFAAVEKLRDRVDTVILCRGGGSLEDLMAFNDEAVVRAVYACTLPVITGVGHETDFTLCDFAADQRAPTPSAAAELAVPDLRELRRMLAGLQITLADLAQDHLEEAANRLAAIREVEALRSPLHLLAQNTRRLQQLRSAIEQSRSGVLAAPAARLRYTAALLDSLSPLKTLGRGYTYTRTADGALLRSVQEVQPGEVLTTVLADGTITAKVVAIHEEKTAL